MSNSCTASKWTSLSWQPLARCDQFSDASTGSSLPIKRGDTQLAIFKVKGQYFCTQQMCVVHLKPKLITLEGCEENNQLPQTKELGITFRSNMLQGSGRIFKGFTNADYPGDQDDRKSTTGWIFTFNNTPLSWSLKKQGLINMTLAG